MHWNEQIIITQHPTDHNHSHSQLFGHVLAIKQRIINGAEAIKRDRHERVDCDSKQSEQNRNETQANIQIMRSTIQRL